MSELPGVMDEAQAYKPFHHQWAMELAEEHEKTHWGTWEVKLQEDVCLLYTSDAADE